MEKRKSKLSMECNLQDTKVRIDLIAPRPMTKARPEGGKLIIQTAFLREVVERKVESGFLRILDLFHFWLKFLQESLFQPVEGLPAKKKPTLEIVRLN